MTDRLPEALADDGLVAFVTAARDDTGPGVRELGAARVRAGRGRRAPGPALHRVRDLDADGVPVRLYRRDPTPAPLLVYCHGGMWSIGDLDSHDRACRRLTARTGVAVLAVDYRLAPEHPWPAAVDDVMTAFTWAVGHPELLSDADGVPAIGGDSAGGTLATLVCLRARDAGTVAPSAQALITPNTDLTLSRPSTVDKATGWGLDTDGVAWGAENWVPDPDRRADPAVSPLFADPAGLPPALLVTCEHDPLRDEGDEYAAALAAAGVPVRHWTEPRMVHGFITLDTLSPAAARAGDRVFDEIAALLDRVG